VDKLMDVFVQFTTPVVDGVFVTVLFWVAVTVAVEEQPLTVFVMVAT
jgi:hypothetical protein